MTETFTFKALIKNAGDGGAYVEVPLDVEQTFGKKRVPVRATFNGEPYRGSLVRMGTACHMLPILKAIREKIGKNFGDEVEIILEEDTEPRVVEVPAELAAAFAGEPQALAFFDGLSYTHRREYVNWINEAKQERTRRIRAAKAIEMLKEGKKGR